MKFFFLILATFLTPLFATAQYTVGNGGYSVKCKDAPTVTLDLYESASFGMTIKYSKKLSPMAKTSELIDRLGKYAPEKVPVYKAWLKQWFHEITWLTDAELKQYDPDDHGTMLTDKNCELKITAIQFHEVNFSYHFFAMSPFLWLELDDNNKAALIFHELLYKDYIQKNKGLAKDRQITSLIVREMNRMLHADEPIYRGHIKYMLTLF